MRSLDFLDICFKKCVPSRFGDARGEYSFWNDTKAV